MLSPSRPINDSYANGYNNSKWATEVLLREAHDLCGLPVAVFRCDMILADTRYAGQLNVPDVFTRTMLSLVATGIAPAPSTTSTTNGNRQRAHYDGLPVDFIAEAIATLGAGLENGYQTYHVLNPYDDGIGFDQFVDWLNEAGYPIQPIADYSHWLQRFETAMRALPERQRQHSVLPLLHYYQHPRSRYAERWHRPNDSTPRCRRRKSARTKTSHTLRPSSSSNTSPTCSYSDCCSAMRGVITRDGDQWTWVFTIGTSRLRVILSGSQTRSPRLRRPPRRPVSPSVAVLTKRMRLGALQSPGA